MAVPVVRVCAQVAYDGTDYHGYQYQIGVPTIQCELERALDNVAVAEGRIQGSGRTDAGVHARGQIIAVAVRWRHSLPDLQRAWNAHLPPDIVIRRLARAPVQFHPRFSARWRTYRYMVVNGVGQVGELSARSPLTDRFALYERRPLNLQAMAAAASCFLGQHDFATFGQPPQGNNTVRNVVRSDWQEVNSNLVSLDENPSRLFVFTVTANAFLRTMVRNLVATLLEIGRGTWVRDDVVKALNARDRRYSPPPAPGCGLVLERVEYPADLKPFPEA